MPRAFRKPAYLLHKSTGQARVRIDRKDHYLGIYGSPESRALYDQLIAAWFSRHGDVSECVLTIDHLAIRYLGFADGYYVKNGQPTSEPGCLRLALQPVVALFGGDLARNFSPKKLKAVQAAMIESGLMRTTINAAIHRIRRAFAWAVSEELVDAPVLEGLRTVRALRAGRSGAREPKPVRHVPLPIVEQTLPHLSRVVADMVRLQLLTGARPGEIVILRPCDVDRTGDVWRYTPEHHKCEHHDQSREIQIGPLGQEILKRYLLRPAEAYCFSPKEALAELHEARHAARRTPPNAGNRPGTNRKPQPLRTAGDCYKEAAYRRAIARGCERAFNMPDELGRIPRNASAAELKELRRQTSTWRKKHVWCPHRLRHLRGTQLREHFDVRTAQAVLGNADVATTVIYAEQVAERSRAEAAMRAIG